MMRAYGLAAIAALGIACGVSGRGDDTGANSHIEIDPADASVTVLNGAPVTQPYTATLVDGNGNKTDVTSTVTWSTQNEEFGTWAGPTLTIGTTAAGPTRVVAMDGAVEGDTGLTVYVKGTRTDGAPDNSGDLFNGATETPSTAPTIAYPTDGILVPPNLGEFDVHWMPNASTDLFEVAMHNTYVDLRIYKMSTGNAYETYTPTEFQTLATPAEELTLTVSGMNSASPTTKSTSTPQHVEVTNETVQGGMYYWTTEPTQGVYRYDMGTPSIAPSPYFTTTPTACIGCHDLSRDGTKMALTLDSGDGRGTIFNVADQSVLVPYDTNPQYWNFATFNLDNSKVVTVKEGVLSLRTVAGGAILSTIPNTSGLLATHPELSPDGTMLANVETSEGGTDYDVDNGSIVTRTYDDGTGTFGPINTLVPMGADTENYYPDWSPDGQWILFTRTTGTSYNSPTAEVWVIKADGSQAPIQLLLADTSGASLTNSWARWAPFQENFGATNEPLFYLTFSTVRPFGVRPTGGTQIWMTPFFPDRAIAGTDPSGPAFRMPFQRIDTSNHIAQWTQAVVIDIKHDGSPLTQYEAVTGKAPRTLR
jgi:hypothetical protein